MIYVFIGLAFCIGVMVGLIMYAGFAEGYFFPSDKKTLHKLLDQHLSSIAEDERKSQ